MDQMLFWCSTDKSSSPWKNPIRNIGRQTQTCQITKQGHAVSGSPRIRTRPGQFWPWPSPFLSVSYNCLAEDEKQDVPMMPHPGAATSVFSWYTGHLLKILFEACFDLFKYVFHFLFITHFHLWQMGSRGPENVWNNSKEHLWQLSALDQTTACWKRYYWKELEQGSLRNREYKTWAMLLITQGVGRDVLNCESKRCIIIYICLLTPFFWFEDTKSLSVTSI